MFEISNEMHICARFHITHTKKVCNKITWREVAIESTLECHAKNNDKTFQSRPGISIKAIAVH